jgi:hypothetical protein
MLLEAYVISSNKTLTLPTIMVTYVIQPYEILTNVCFFEIKLVNKNDNLWNI